MNNEEKSHKKFLSTKELIITILIVLIFGVLYAATLTGYIKEGQNNALPYVVGDEQEQNNIAVNAKVLSLDPVKGEMAVRVDITPQGDLTEDGGLTSTQNLKIFVNGATGQLERSYEKGKAISPFDVIVNLDGLVNDYPFDNYDSMFTVYITAQADKEAEEVEVPVLLNFTANLPGFSITASENKEGSPANPIMDIAINRSATVISVAVAGMIIMWAIGIAVIFLTMTFIFRNRKAEAFAFYSGLLFGLFGLRNSLPGTPPIGTQSDFLAFIWVEAIVAIAMVVTIAFSLARPQK